MDQKFSDPHTVLSPENDTVLGVSPAPTDTVYLVIPCNYGIRITVSQRSVLVQHLVYGPRISLAHPSKDPQSYFLRYPGNGGTSPIARTILIPDVPETTVVGSKKGQMSLNIAGDVSAVMSI